MPYLFSAITDKLPVEESDQALCYYTNNTDIVQTIRTKNQGTSYLEYVVFPGERVLFATLLNSYLEIDSCDLNQKRTTRIDCKLLYV